MIGMSKYYNLKEYLLSTTGEELTLTFKQMENILGFSLSKTLRTYQAAWSGSYLTSPTHVWKKSREDAGYKIKKFDLKEGMITFEKGGNYNSDGVENHEMCDNKLIFNFKKNKSERTILTVTETDILKEEKEVYNDEIYGNEVKIISKVLNKFKLNNDDIEIAVKISIIDITNNTNLSKHKNKLSLNNVVKIIKNIDDFDNRVKNGDPELVNEISKTCKKNYGINIFSFSTKYCCYHNTLIYGKDDYSIYDSIVKENLYKYHPGLNKRKVENFKNNFDYQGFNESIKQILDFNGIKLPNRRRAFDHYLRYKGRKEK